MEVDNQMLQQITTDVMSGMLGLDLIHVSDQPEATDGVIAAIRISGDWETALELRASWPSANRIASRMFDLDIDDLTEEETCDALGEIANMIGGNLKGILNGETRLSLPCVGKDIVPDEPRPGTNTQLLQMKFGMELISIRLTQEELMAAASQ
ncbi:chemotaxis protein CheX [Planctomicrobium sp. SH668]|uniref:chemotaxis protein CheX n=1 Tax=Planctomicrobium sp. SH668 TaxID=3448126 RepID=UPI003F5C9B65